MKSGDICIPRYLKLRTLKSELRECVVKAELKRDCYSIEKFTKKLLLTEGSRNVQVSMKDFVPPDLPF